MIEENKEEAYGLTIKGWLAVQTGMFGAFSPIWDALAKRVLEQAEKNGMPPGGLPCLILVDGGHCITAEKKMEKSEV